MRNLACAIGFLAFACGGAATPKSVVKTSPNRDVHVMTDLGARPFYVDRSAGLPWTSPYGVPPVICQSNGPCVDYWSAPAVPGVEAVGNDDIWPREITSACEPSSISKGYLALPVDDVVATFSPGSVVNKVGDMHPWDYSIFADEGTSDGTAGEPTDASAMAGELFIGFLAGDITSFPSKDSLPLRPLVSAVNHGDAPSGVSSVFGIPGEFYQVNRDGAHESLTRVAGESWTATTYESASLARFWMNKAWVLRAFSTTSGRVWEASRLDGRFARVIAYGGLGACGTPLYKGQAVTLDVTKGEVDVVAIELNDGTIAWRVPGVPLDQPQCLSVGDGAIVVGGMKSGRDSVAFYENGKWQVVGLGGNNSVVEPSIRGDAVVATAPAEDVVAPNQKGVVTHAGAAYILKRTSRGWAVQKRVTARKPKEFGLFGFRTVLLGDRALFNYYGGERAADAASGVPDGTTEICQFAI